MSNKDGNNCIHSESIVSNKINIENFDKKLTNDENKHEAYRLAIHDRMNKIHAIMNTLRSDVYNDFGALKSQLESIDHNQRNQAEFIKEFKGFVKDITEAVNGIRTCISNIEERRTFKAQAMEFTFKLGAFALTIIGIIKYLGMPSN